MYFRRLHSTHAPVGIFQCSDGFSLTFLAVHVHLPAEKSSVNFCSDPSSTGPATLLLRLAEASSVAHRDLSQPRTLFLVVANYISPLTMREVASTTLWMTHLQPLSERPALRYVRGSVEPRQGRPKWVNDGRSWIALKLSAFERNADIHPTMTERQV